MPRACRPTNRAQQGLRVDVLRSIQPKQDCQARLMRSTSKPRTQKHKTQLASIEARKARRTWTTREHYHGDSPLKFKDKKTFKLFSSHTVYRNIGSPLFFTSSSVGTRQESSKKQGGNKRALVCKECLTEEATR